MLGPEVRSGWRRIGIVAMREIRERGGSRSYRISTVLAVLAVIAIIVLPSLVGRSTTYHVGVTGAVPPGTASALKAQAKAAGRDMQVDRFSTVSNGEKAVRDKKIDVLLVDGARLEWRTTADGALTAVIANAVQAVHIRNEASRLGIDAAQLDTLLAPVTLSTRTIGAANIPDRDANTVALVAVAALYVAISFYAGFVLTGVVQEKANRVAEVLLARMPAREILAGKVLGIGAVGLAQFAMIGVAAGLTVQMMSHADAPSIPAGALALTVGWFIVGYLFYSVAYAALGATTSRIEDAQSAIAPITGLMLLSYLGVIYAEENPGAPLTVVLSYFPPTAPVVMTYRVGVHAAPAWQIVTSALLMAAVIWGLIRVGGRVYAGGLLRFGTRVPLRDLWRATKA